MHELLQRLTEGVDWVDIGWATIDTFLMLGGGFTLTLLLGLPLGVVLFLTSPKQLLSSPRIYTAISFLVNIMRSLPFVILLIAMVPLTTLLTGTSLGVAGAIPPLVAGGTPFFARLVESALHEVDTGIIEATQAMGANIRQIVIGALLPEALPGLISAATVTAIALVSYTALSGVVGGGGLGDLAIRYGYQRFQLNVMFVTIILLLVLVQILQTLGNRLAAHFARH
jgi:D-methionine transport system permease protein